MTPRQERISELQVEAGKLRCDNIVQEARINMRRSYMTLAQCGLSPREKIAENNRRLDQIFQEITELRTGVKAL